MPRVNLLRWCTQQGFVNVLCWFQLLCLNFGVDFFFLIRMGSGFNFLVESNISNSSDAWQRIVVIVKPNIRMPITMGSSIV